MTRKRIVLIEGILLLVFSFIGLGEGIYLIANLDPFAVRDELGPGWFVIAVSLVLMVTAASHLIVHYRKEIVMTKAPVDKALRLRMISMVFAMAGYILAIDIAGYMVSTPLFFLVQFRLAGVTSWRTNIIATTAVSAFYYLVFVHYCEMVFPRGIFH